MLNLHTRRLMRALKSGTLSPEKFLREGLEDLIKAVENNDIRNIPGFDGKYMDIMQYISQEFDIDLESYKKQHELIFRKFDKIIEHRTKMQKEKSLETKKVMNDIPRNKYVKDVIKFREFYGK